MSNQSDEKKMNCIVYKSLVKDETYVFVESEDSLQELPDELTRVMGKTEKVMELTLTADRQLARCRGQDVINSIREQGFHLQMPEKLHVKNIPDYKQTLQEKE